MNNICAIIRYYSSITRICRRYKYCIDSMIASYVTKSIARNGAHRSTINPDICYYIAGIRSNGKCLTVSGRYDNCSCGRNAAIVCCCCRYGIIENKTCADSMVGSYVTEGIAGNSAHRNAINQNIFYYIVVGWCNSECLAGIFLYADCTRRRDTAVASGCCRYNVSIKKAFVNKIAGTIIVIFDYPAGGSVLCEDKLVGSIIIIIQISIGKRRNDINKKKCTENKNK
ncbi:hypothetical protein ASZ90_006855 [hydrocarbon metagenome]|uniref:Uncharacterized protein n=1 Tax=hydrocarbon metagenome TaxID=938273 RepID=A0A0W8FR26_9ZZZZ